MKTDYRYVIMSRKTNFVFVRDVVDGVVQWTTPSTGGEMLFDSIKKANQYIANHRLNDVMVIGRDTKPRTLTQDNE